jgi:hypothetical protein
MIPISTFLKFGRLEHLQEMRKGVLFMQPLNYFQKLDSDEAKRSDSNEGLIGIYQPDKIKLSISANGQYHELSDLAGPVLVTSSALMDVHAFCMFALTPGEYEVDDEIFEGNKLKIKFDSAHEKFGGHVLYTINALELQTRILRAVKENGKKTRCGLVEYVSETKFHGQVPSEKIGFYKLDTFKTQHEYRVLIYNSGKPNEPIRLSVGNLSDITEIARWNELDIKLRKNEE